jgi:uncharacterized protein (TIGR00255 family)
MRSMTGFGRGISEQAGVRATVDLRTVNHRFLDLKVRGSLPPATEEAVATKIRAALERGSVAVSIHVARATAGGIRIDEAAARAAHATLRRLANDLGLVGPDLKLVLAQPGVVVSDSHQEDPDPAHATILAATDAALAQLATMRETEGLALARDLLARLDELSTARAELATRAAAVPAELQRKLHERVQRLLGDHAADPQRLAHEVALLADRADVSEELVRLDSHLAQARALVADPKPSGRRLDFLTQEIGRELNTIGSKSAAADLTSTVVAGKAALEKLREQVQNVE